MFNGLVSKRRRRAVGVSTACAAVFFLLFASLDVLAHPLGDFTTNHFTRIEVGTDGVRVRFVVDTAEIPAFQELQAMGHNPLVRALPVVSACVGVVICYQTLAATGFDLLTATTAAATASGAGEATEHDVNLASMGAMAVLSLGLVFGLKHATEVDHVVAVSTIVSEHRNILRAALVGGLWGIGHTASLLVVGAIVLALKISIPESVAGWLEFGVALMIVGLGANALVRALRRRDDVHIHTHTHNGQTHSHLHFHEHNVEGAEHPAEQESPTIAHSHAAHSHALRRIGLKPLIVGAVHGLAGSATLTLLVLTQINSALLGMIYLAVFGLGSIVGMLLMSGLVGLPFAFSARKVAGLNYGLQTLAGLASIAFGVWYAYETGIASGLLM